MESLEERLAREEEERRLEEERQQKEEERQRRINYFIIIKPKLTAFRVIFHGIVLFCYCSLDSRHLYHLRHWLAIIVALPPSPSLYVLLPHVAHTIVVPIAPQPQGWVTVVRRMIRKRTRIQYANDLGTLHRRKRFFDLFCVGCRNIKRQRIEQERKQRRALERLVDSKIAHVHKLFNGMVAFAEYRREKRARRLRLLRQAYERWMRMQKNAVFQRYADMHGRGIVVVIPQSHSHQRFRWYITLHS